MASSNALCANSTNCIPRYDSERKTERVAILREKLMSLETHSTTCPPSELISRSEKLTL